jgi:hypothetical protein
MTNIGLIKRLEALEKKIAARPPRLLMVWTRNLAKRIEPILPKGNWQLVYCAMDDEDGSFEAGLRERNPKQAAYLDALLRGEIPDGY